MLGPKRNMTLRFKPPMSRLLAGIALFLAAVGPLPAWKVITHAHLAFIARADALDDGKIVIYLADHDTGRLVLNAAGKPEEIGRYEVDPRILRVLRDFPEHFRAGVIGTDVLPDMLTAQTIVHPDNGAIGRTTSDEWLDLIWTDALKTWSDRALAFAAGYLAHGAGDLYGHTFVNDYAGGPFMLGRNALKHFVLESYIDNRTPREDGFFDISIEGIEPFLHRTLVVQPMIWRPGTDSIRGGAMINYSPPRVFQAMREQIIIIAGIARETLKQAEKDYPARIRQLTSEAARCAKSDPVKSARLTADAAALSAEFTALKAASKAGIAYLSAWIKDIDEGLKAWPDFGRRLAGTIFFCAATDKQAASSAAQDFMNAHGLSMCGLPDMLGETLARNKRFYEMIPKDIRDLVDLFKTDPVLYLLEKAWGLTWDLVKNPAVHFDEIMNDPPGMRTTLRAFNRDVLKITDIGNTTSETYDWQNIPAMVNTVTMTKLSWLSPGGFQAFIRDLEDRGYTSNTVEPLIAAPENGKPMILGFMKSLDHDNQWCEDPKLLFVRDPCVYKRLFLKQIGEDEPGCLPGCDTPPDGSVVASPVESALAPGSNELDMGRRPNGAVVEWGKAFIIFTKGGTAAFHEFARPEVKSPVPPAAAAVVFSPEDNVVVLALDGTVWTWGFEAHARAGMYGTRDQFEPLQIPNLQSLVQLSAGTRHVLALRSNGQIWVWGGNARGELGIGQWTRPPRPRRVPGLGGIRRVAAGDYFSAAVTADGKVWSWGANDFSQLGGGRGEDRYSPAPVAGITDVQDAAAGYAHVLALKTDGTVWAWGKNDQGQIGDGTNEMRPEPVRVPGLKGIRAVAAGGYQSAALDGNGVVWVWGGHLMDRGGLSGKTRYSPIPFKVDDLPPIVAVACGENHALALDKDGFVWTWGAKARSPDKIPGLNLLR
jgi:hypothetical protein